jgi:hypothetical protein
LLAWLVWRAAEIHELRGVSGTSWVLPLPAGHEVYVQRLRDGTTTVFVERARGENVLTWDVAGP